MTRKDYVTLAHDLNDVYETIKAENSREAMAAFIATVGVVVTAMKRENGRFDSTRFYAAVGL